MSNLYRKIGTLTLFLAGALCTHAQSTVSGSVSDKDGTLAGATVVIIGTTTGTTTDVDGKFTLQVNQGPPFTIEISFVGMVKSTVEITQANTAGLNIVLEADAQTLGEVIVSGYVIDEVARTLPIVKMGALQVQTTPAADYYRGLANLKGIDMTTSSINFQIVNARGFNSTGNARFVQWTDGMDTQAPALNFPIGNLNGPSELDVESVEIIPGAASALFGPSAFNGAILVNSKNPFEYQGLTAMAKLSFNHMGDSDLDSEDRGEVGPGGAQPIYEAAFRYAKAYNNKFAFKVAFSYSQATDWYGTNFQDKATIRTPTGFSFNPGAERVHAFGDEASDSLGLLKINPSFTTAMAGQGLSAFVPYLPDHIVSRTPYDEEYLVDYDAKNIKANVSLNYKLNDKTQLILFGNYGAGTSVYTGAQRYSLKDFYIWQGKLELKGDNFFLRGYTTTENSGDSYIADLTGVLINDAWMPNSAWFGTYAGNYLGSLAIGGFIPGGAGPTVPQQESAHQFARAQADLTRYQPGSAEFENAKTAARSATIPAGALFQDETAMYHAEGQYNFKNQITFMNLMVGASYRLYDLNSNGTIFADVPGNDITINEYGAYLQAAKSLSNDKLILTGSVRYDKNENFDGQINPRISASFAPSLDHNIRLAYQTGFRNPTSQAQHIDLNVVSARLIGGLPYYAEKYNIYEYAYDLFSVNNYVAAVSAAGNSLAIGDPTVLDNLVPITYIDPVKPEKVNSIDVGYQAVLGTEKDFNFDISYYYNSYKDFIAQRFLRKAAGAIDLDATVVTEQNIRNAQTLLTPITTPGQENTFSTYTNVQSDVSSQGLALGATYRIGGRGYNVGFNYNWNKLNEELGGGYLSEFNTPEHKFNVMFGNRTVTDNLGFNVAFRWQDEFYWESSFGQGTVPSAAVLDAQVSYKVESLKSTIKLGGSNLANTRYVLNYGGPTLGAIYYLSVIFDPSQFK